MHNQTHSKYATRRDDERKTTRQDSTRDRSAKTRTVQLKQARAFKAAGR